MKEKKLAYSTDLIEMFCRVTNTVDVVCPSHVNLETEFVVVRSGELIMEIENVRYCIKKNEGIFVLPFEAHSFESENCECTIIIFSRNVAKSFHEFIQNKTPLTRIFPLPNIFFDLIQTFCPNDKTYYQFEKLQAEGILAPIISQIANHCKFKVEKTIKNDLISSALSSINENFLSHMSLEEVAEQIGCHPVTLSKTFYATIGIHFSQYISLRRCYYAKALLDNTKNSITDIALEAGFGSLRDFNRCFKKIFSLSPSQYRKMSIVI